MDKFNEIYPLYPDNPDTSDSDLDEHLDKIIEIKKRETGIFNEYEWKYYHSDDMWYLWCTMNEFTAQNGLCFFDRLTYSQFCEIV